MDRKSDVIMSGLIWDGIKAVQTAPITDLISDEHMRHYWDLRLGEVSRHFDTNTSAQISGYMSHDLGFHGWGAGIRIGGIGLGTGQLGLSGQSQVAMSSNGVNRQDLA